MIGAAIAPTFSNESITQLLNLFSMNIIEFFLMLISAGAGTFAICLSIILYKTFIAEENSEPEFVNETIEDFIGL
jgi:hypothetical protein